MNFDKQINSILGKKLNHPILFAKKTKKDLDGDGISNKKDCQPKNPIRQDNNYGSSPLGKLEGLKSCNKCRAVQQSTYDYCWKCGNKL